MTLKVVTSLTAAMTLVLLSTVAAISDSTSILCPDSVSSCDADSTCCGTGDGHWACCQLKDAQCCSDGQHCCPAGTRCNTQQSSCDPVVPGNVSIPAVRKVPKPTTTTPMPPSTTTPENAGMVCTDRSQCPQPGAACCRQYSGRYGCCNYPLNVCCDDGIHCCHSGTVCDQLRLVCVPYPSTGLRRLPWSQLQSPSTAAVQASAAAADDDGGDAQLQPETRTNRICPDGRSCLDTQTCCRIYSGGYGCCPYYLGVCCPDLQHCCPSGDRCTVGGQCISKDSHVKLPWATLAAAKP
jgi:hypothetical protein